MSTQAHAETVRSRRRSRPVSELVVSGIGLALVGVLVVWLLVNLFEDWSTFLQLSFSGLTRGSMYALVALGYTLVYGILELINFAHGDVFMIGGMVTATVVDPDVRPRLESVDRHAPPRDSHLARGGNDRVRAPQCHHRAGRVQAVTQRAATRSADHRDRDRVHPRGHRLRLEGPAGRCRFRRTRCPTMRSSRSARARSARRTAGTSSSSCSSRSRSSSRSCGWFGTRSEGRRCARLPRTRTPPR